jgi:glucose/arabinose dehydrogenase
LKLTELVNAIPSPIVAASPPGDTERLFIGAVAGTIRVFQNGSLQPVFLDITNRIKSGGEQGLLGLAFHPDFTQNGRFFVHYTANDVTAPNGDAVISEFSTMAGDPSKGDPASEKILLTLDDPFGNHNGGAMHFRDGMLFIGFGDGGSVGDPLNNGQTLSSLFGKIIRIDVDNPSGGLEYGIPSGNMTGAGVAPELWSYGLRNPWRWSFDACSGDMYIGDVGQGMWEEVDVEPKSTGSGTNFGWRVMEGAHCHSPATGCDQSGKQLPVAEYDHGQGCSITGGYVYRGSAIPGLRGWYIYADFCSGRFWMFRYAAGVAEDLQEITSQLNPGTTLNSVASFGQDANGEIYVMIWGGGSRVFRIDAQ